MRANRLLIALLLPLLALMLLAAARGVPAPLLEWDPELDALGVTLAPAADCSQGCWRLVSANLLDPDEGGGNHHVFTRLYVGGLQVAGGPWHVAWDDGDDRALSKLPPEWSDIPLWQCYFPNEGPGPYRSYAGDVEAESDVVRGMGLPVCFHYSFRLEWEWDEGQPVCLECIPRAYLPVVKK